MSVFSRLAALLLCSAVALPLFASSALAQRPGEAIEIPGGPIVDKEAEENPTPETAYAAFQRGLYVSAFKQATKLAEKGTPSAQTLLALIYQNGIGVPSNQAQAIKWYSAAALAGDPEAQFALGLILARGDGTPKDKAKAKGWFEAAAAQGHIEAHYNLSLLYMEGEVVERDFKRAAQLLGADVVDLGSSGSSVSKGETLADSARTIAAMGVDAIVVRATAPGAAGIVADAVRCSVINAGDGRHEHPTQGLLDAYTLAEGLGRLDTLDLSGVRVAIVGDVVNSRVARSAIHAMRTTPPTFLPTAAASSSTMSACSSSPATRCATGTGWKVSTPSGWKPADRPQ